jgi:hypothetical protein
MEVRRSGSGQTRTEGNEAAHGSNWARTAAEGPATRQGRGERESGSRKGCAGRQHAGNGMQRMAVSPLGELRPRPSRYAGKSRAVREELQCGGCERIRTGAAEPRVEDVGGH